VRIYTGDLPGTPTSRRTAVRVYTGDLPGIRHVMAHGCARLHRWPARHPHV